MNYENIIYEVKNNIGFITLNQPDRQNIINDALIAEFDDILVKNETELEPKVLVIKGAGSSFCAGEDLSGTGADEISCPPPGSSTPIRELMDSQRRRARRWEYIFNYPKPIIAQVHGSCIGAGLYLAMVCDIIIAEENAVFGDPSLRMGIISSIPLWNWLIGTKKTKELILLGRDFSAKEAELFNLINFSVSADKLEEEVNKYAKAISICPGDALPLLKESINGTMETRGIGEAWRFLGDIQILAQQSSPGLDDFDFRRIRDEEGLDAAVTKRDKPFKDFGF